MQMISKKDDSLNILLILSNYYDPLMPSWPEVMGIFGKEMQKRGHRVDWVVPYRTGTREKPLMKKYCDADLYLIPFTKNRNILIEFLSIPIYQFRLFLTLNEKFRRTKYDIILVRDDVLSGLTVFIFKQLKKTRIAINYSFPHLLGAKDTYDGSVKSALNLVYVKILDTLSTNILLPNSDLIFPISSRMKDDFINLGISPERMHPIPLGVDTTVFHEMDINRNLIKCHDEDFVFIYIGSIDWIRGLDVLIDAMRIAIDQDNTIKLVFVGNGNHLIDLQKMVSDRGLTDRIIFTNRVSFEEVPKYLQCADVALSIINPLECFRVCSPCKIFEYMAMKKPLIANFEIPEHKDVICSSNCGLLVEFSEKSIADAMIEMAEQKRNNNEEFNKWGINGYRWVISNRTFSKLADDVELSCRRIVSKQ